MFCHDREEIREETVRAVRMHVYVCVCVCVPVRDAYKTFLQVQVKSQVSLIVNTIRSA